ncbi:bifunctional nicotinamidase/pyrazinamidase [Breznakiellaceae bacterium SP9]
MIINFEKSALLEVDVQNDFCPLYQFTSGEIWPGGTLQVNDADEVIPPLNRAAELFAANGGQVVASQDWHPPAHSSFASSHPGTQPGDTIGRQVLWTDHCIQWTAGAAFHDTLNLKPINFILRKGTKKDIDSYSAFFDADQGPTGLDGFLRGLGITTVFIGGLATDYCVLYSAMDASKLGYKTYVLEDAIAGVGIPKGSIEKAVLAMKGAGIVFIKSSDITGNKA